MSANNERTSHAFNRRYRRRSGRSEHLAGGHPRRHASRRESVDLFWLPFSPRDASRLVRWSGWVFEEIDARHHGRQRRDLYDSALGGPPRWGALRHRDDPGMEQPGPRPRRRQWGPGWSGPAWVVLPCFDTRCTVGAAASFRTSRKPLTAPSILLSSDRDMAQRVLDLVGIFPTRTSGTRRAPRGRDVELQLVDLVVARQEWPRDRQHLPGPPTAGLRAGPPDSSWQTARR